MIVFIDPHSLRDIFTAFSNHPIGQCCFVVQEITGVLLLISFSIVELKLPISHFEWYSWQPDGYLPVTAVHVFSS